MAASVACRSCGVRIKPGPHWCPRCGESLAPAPADASTPARSGNSRWLIGGSVVLLLVLLAAAASIRPAPDATATAASLETRPAAKIASPTAGAAVPIGPVAAKDRPFLDPDRAGNAAYLTSDYNGAMAEYQEAIQKNPDDAPSLNNLGQVLVRAGRSAEALPYFDRAIALNASVWAPRFNRARAYGEVGDWAKAIAEYQVAAELLPDDYVTQYNLGRAFHKSGQEEPAVTAYQRAIALAPGEPSFRLALGISYERLKKSEDAAKTYEEYLELVPDAADAQKIKARIQALRNSEASAPPPV